MLHGYPIAASLPEDLGLGERFWYWRGRSGRAYIHSIYSRENCPPVAGAVYVVVDNLDGTRHAANVGRFPQYLEGRMPDISMLCPEASANAEIHIHLLARNEECAGMVLADLRSALVQGADVAQPAEHDGFREPSVQIELAAA
jgi:hypothetical protein